MLYDNAQLVPLLLDTYRASGEGYFLDVAEDVLRYVGREMVSPDGGFYATQDADSEGEEGKFFLWEREQVLSLLGTEMGEIFCRVYDVSDIGNFERHNILHVTLSDEQAGKMFGKPRTRSASCSSMARARLFEAREPRVKPFRDEKIIAAWNGLMLTAYADALRVTGNPEYRRIAEGCAAFVRRRLCVWGPDAPLLQDGEAKVPGFLDDYAALGVAFIDLYEATSVVEHLEWAERVTERMLESLLGRCGRWILLHGGGPRAADRPHQTRARRLGSVGRLRSPPCSACGFTRSRKSSDTRAPLSACSVSTAARWRRIRSPMPISSRRSTSTRDSRRSSWWPRAGAKPPPSYLALSSASIRPEPRHRLLRSGGTACAGAAVRARKPLIDSRPTAYVCHAGTCSPPVTDWQGLRRLVEERV